MQMTVIIIIIIIIMATSIIMDKENLQEIWSDKY